MDKATVLKEGTDVAIIVRRNGNAGKGCGRTSEMQGNSATVLDMYCVKPLDSEAVVKAARIR